MPAETRDLSLLPSAGLMRGCAFPAMQAWVVVRSPPLTSSRGSSRSAIVLQMGSQLAVEPDPTLPPTVTAAKMVEEKGAHATSLTLSPKSKDRTACAPSATTAGHLRDLETQRYAPSSRAHITERYDMMLIAFAALSRTVLVAGGACHMTTKLMFVARRINSR